MQLSFNFFTALLLFTALANGTHDPDRWDESNIHALSNFCEDMLPERVVLDAVKFSPAGSRIDLGDFCSGPINDLHCPALQEAMETCERVNVRIWVAAWSPQKFAPNASELLRSQFAIHRPFKTVHIKRFIVRIMHPHNDASQDQIYEETAEDSISELSDTEDDARSILHSVPTTSVSATSVENSLVQSSTETVCILGEATSTTRPMLPGFQAGVGPWDDSLRNHRFPQNIRNWDRLRPFWENRG